jgi:transposase
MSWRQGQPYSQDLRERVLSAVDGGMPAYQAASVFRVSVSFIYKALGRRRRTGETTARPQRGHLPQKLEAYHQAIRDQVALQPDAMLDELRAWMLANHGVSVSQGGMWNALDRLGLTLKKRRNTRPSNRGPMLPRPALRGANASRA